MTDTTPEIYLRDLLRAYLTDPNSSRVASTPYIVSRWPYQTDLVTNHFPRISVINQFNSAKPFGLGSSVFWKTPRLQIDVWVKSDQPLTIDSVVYEGIEQVTKIANDVEDTVQTNWISYLASTGKLIILQSFNWYSPKYEYDYNFWRITGDVTFANIKT
jgi:hypothetical protein